MNILTKLFGKTGKQAHLHIDHPDGIPISMEEAKRLEGQHAAELKAISGLQQKLKEDTAMLRQVVDNKLSPGARKEVYDILAAGEDPLLLAAYLKVPFKEVAIVANDVLQDAFAKGNFPESVTAAPRIPTDVQEYIKLARELEAAKKDLRNGK